MFDFLAQNWGWVVAVVSLFALVGAALAVRLRKRSSTSKPNGEPADAVIVRDRATIQRITGDDPIPASEIEELFGFKTEGSSSKDM